MDMVIFNEMSSCPVVRLDEPLEAYQDLRVRIFVREEVCGQLGCSESMSISASLGRRSAEICWGLSNYITILNTSK